MLVNLTPTLALDIKKVECYRQLSQNNIMLTGQYGRGYAKDIKT
jgi:hypothetical protein